MRAGRVLGGAVLRAAAAVRSEPSSDAYREDRLRHELMRELESRRRQRAVAVTTDDGEVRAQLRQHAEPVTLFGEGPGDRRDRLRRLLARLDAADGGALPVPEDAGVVPESQAVAQKEVFYTEGSAELAAARGHRGVLDAAGGGAAEAAARRAAAASARRTRRARRRRSPRWTRTRGARRSWRRVRCRGRAAPL